MRIAIIALLLMHCAVDPSPKHVMTKSSSATLTITGTVTREGVECPAVRGDDGKLYTIVGAGRENLTPGVKVRIVGTVAEVSTCMQGTTINATQIEVVGPVSF
jgi:acetylglutamate kinase